VKSSINIQSFTKQSDKMLLIFIIIILKNANNLILELGTFAFMQFLDDIKYLLVENIEGKGQQKKSTQILNEFSMFNVTSETEKVL
jgi:hypothetical protein